MGKDWLIALLKKRGYVDVSPLENPDVGEENFVFAIQRKKLKVGEGFFEDLAEELKLPFIRREQLKGKSDLAVVMPYGMLKENLILPLDISTEKVKIATANPLNRELFSELESIFGREVELCTASIETIEEAIDRGYEEIHKHRALRDLYYRSPDESAYRVLYPWQRLLIIGLSFLFMILFIVNYPASFILVFAAINIIYFCINPVKFYISFKGFREPRRAVHVSDDEVKKLDVRNLPVYTILIPLYREAKVLPHILRNVHKMDYPKDKLDVKILMEEKDEVTLREAKRLGLFGEPSKVIVSETEIHRSKGNYGIELYPSMKVIDDEGNPVGTLESVVTGGGRSEAILIVKSRSGRMMEIPQSFVKSAYDVVLLKDSVDRLIERYREFLKVFDAVIVPEADVKTKPRACNYGLLRARGEYCVIYDAEDDPEPDQLKKAVITFSRFGKDLVCLQSHLNFYNPRDNLLTRWFSLEYSYWFDYYLEGLDHVGAPLPLGGTSNHFRTQQLRELGGWDPYNMTEDADLGVRISRTKMRTAMLNSYTFEEANRWLWNWVRQRSRWNKGYIQTYLVHMRHPRKLINDLGWKRFFFFQLTFGGNVFLPLVNPLLWAVTLLTLLIPGIFQFLFFYPIAYICMINLVIGNLVYISLHLGPYILRKNYTSIPFAIVIPLYWMLISIGAWRGMIQLITKPFYWEKTEHGLSKLLQEGTKMNQSSSENSRNASEQVEEAVGSAEGR